MNGPVRECAYCGKEIDPRSPDVWQLVVGWQQKAQGATRKGGSDIVLRQARDRFACDGCIRRKKRGIAPTQQSLGGSIT